MPATTAETCSDELRLLTADQAGRMVGVDGRVIRNWHRFGRLVGVRAGREIRWRQRDVLRYVDSLKPVK